MCKSVSLQRAENVTQCHSDWLWAWTLQHSISAMTIFRVTDGISLKSSGMKLVTD